MVALHFFAGRMAPLQMSSYVIDDFGNEFEVMSCGGINTLYQALCFADSDQEI